MNHGKIYMYTVKDTSFIDHPVINRKYFHNFNHIQIADHIFYCQHDKKIKAGEIKLNSYYRNFLDLDLNEEILIESYIPSVDEELNCCDVKISLIKETKKDSLSVTHQELTEMLYDYFDEQILQSEMQYYWQLDNGIYLIQLQKLQIDNYYVDDPDKLTINQITLGKNTDTQLQITDGVAMLSNEKINLLEMGIGGLKKEFNLIFRKALASRNYSASFINSIGISHVKGIILAGPSGTGKTLLVKQISKMLNCHPPKIVNGPELFNKYVGESEKKMRELFRPAEEEAAEKGAHSKLHLIIFDEIDAIAKTRGTLSSSTGTADNLVNQLLTKMDGLEELHNILVFGMTNRLDLIDSALLRPGRFELIIKMKLPTSEERMEILQIHTSQLQKNKKMESINLQEIAHQTNNYTGAELAGLVRAATSFALEKGIENQGNKLKGNAESMMVKVDHFQQALQDITPRYGSSNQIKKLIPLKCHFPKFQEIIISQVNKKITHFLAQKKDNLMVLGLLGKTKSGKTTLACYLAEKSPISLVRRIDNYSLLGLSDNQKCSRLKGVLQEAKKAESSIIIIDNVEILVQLSLIKLGNKVKMYLNHPVLNTLHTLLTTPAPEKHVIFIITCEVKDHLSLLGLDKMIPNIYSISLDKKDLNGDDS